MIEQTTPQALAVDTAGASRLTGIPVRSLEGLRLRGGGPKFTRAGKRKVLYLLADLQAWLEENRRSSTSDPGPEGGR
ncbi:MAG: DNA-binding protein [Candidatus Methylomirabilis sp.]|nr:DNA-binding protein [Deltaproteobacteria bacterium]